MIKKSLLSAALLSLVWSASSYCMDYDQPKFKNKRQLQTADGKIFLCDLKLCQLSQVIRNAMNGKGPSYIIKLSNVTEDDWKALQPGLQLMASGDIEALYNHVRDCSLDQLNNLLKYAIKLGIRTADNRINLSNIISHVIEQQSSRKNEENPQDQTPESKTEDKHIEVQEKTKEKEKEQNSSNSGNNLQQEHVDGVEVPRDSMVGKLSRVIKEQMEAFDDSSDTISLPNVTESAWKLLKPVVQALSENKINEIKTLLNVCSLDELITIMKVAEYLDIRTPDDQIILVEVIAEDVAQRLLTESKKKKFLNSDNFVNGFDFSDILLKRLAKKIMQQSTVKALILQEVPVLCKVLQGRTNCCVISAVFNRTGNKIVSVSFEDHAIGIWDVKTGTCERILQGHTGWVWSAVFNRTGDKIVSASQDGAVRIWDVKTGTCEQVLQGHTDIVNSAAFNRTGDKIVSASQDGAIRIWDAKTGTCERVLQGHTDRVNSAAFNRTEDKIVSVSADKTVRIWDVKTGTCERILQGRTNCVMSAAFNRTGDKIVSASDDHTIRMWDVKMGACERVFQGHTDIVNSAAFNRTGDKIVSASEDHTIRIWDVKTGTCERILQGHTDAVISAAFNRAEDKIVSVSADKTVRIWDLNNLLALQQYLENNLTLDQALLLICWHDAQTNNRQLNILQNHHLEEIYDSIENQEIRDIVRPRLIQNQLSDDMQSMMVRENQIPVNSQQEVRNPVQQNQVEPPFVQPVQQGSRLWRFLSNRGTQVMAVLPVVVLVGLWVLKSLTKK